MTEYTGGFLEDQELLTRYRQGDNSAFGLLYSRYESRALAYARRHTNNQTSAEDLASEAFARILETIRRGKGPTVSMNHYLITTIRTLAWRNDKAVGPEEVVAPEIVAEMFEKEMFQDDSTTEDWLVDAFNRLDERRQNILWLRLVEGFTSSSIATQLGMTGSSVTRQYQSAVNDLRKNFVALAVEASPDPECRSSIPQLMTLAESVGPRAKAKEPDNAWASGHLASCARCQTVTHRLRAPEAALLSIVVLAGLGTIGTQALAPSAASASVAATGWFASLALPAKVALIAVPTVALVGAVVVVSNALFSQPVNALPDVFLDSDGSSNSQTQGGSTALLTQGGCVITREPQPGNREVWRLSQQPKCNARINFIGDDGTSATLTDTFANPSLRFIEVVRTGTYSIELDDGSSSTTAQVRVR